MSYLGGKMTPNVDTNEEVSVCYSSRYSEKRDAHAGVPRMKRINAVF